MVTITSSSLRANVYEHVYDILTAANLLSSAVTVTAAFIDDDQAFPQVVVNPASVDKDDPTLGRASFKNTIMVPIDIFTRKNKHIDQISDEIDTLSGLKTVSGLSLVGWDESVDFSPQQMTKIHEKRIMLTYMRR